MKILHEGTAHIRDKFICECNFCETKVQIWDKDPMTKRTWSGHDGVEYEMKWICPVCKAQNISRTHHDHHYDGMEIEKNALMTKEDKKEVEQFEMFSTKELSDEDLRFLGIKYYSDDDPRNTDNDF